MNIMLYWDRRTEPFGWSYEFSRKGMKKRTGRVNLPITASADQLRLAVVNIARDGGIEITASEVTATPMLQGGCAVFYRSEK